MDRTGVVATKRAAGDDLEAEADVDPVLLEKAARRIAPASGALVDSGKKL
jgi:hypothetical protein